ncbi:MAG: hypothetical protein IPI67_41725 [Myxococcales bacterium]|nr:hypothetical protein [Myxococcales bacterium]
MNKQRMGAVLALVVAFGLGAVAGGFGTKSFVLHRFAERFGGPPGRARMGFRIEAMTRALDLDSAQREKVKQVFERHEDERRRAFERCEPEHRALREKIDAEIREILTPDQRIKHDALRRRFDRPPGEGPPSGPSPG